MSNDKTHFLYMMPFVVALGALLFIPGEGLRGIQVIGLCCSFIGIVVAFNESLRLPTLNMLIDDAMLMGAAVLWGATTIIIKTTPLAGISPSKTLLYQLIVSSTIYPPATGWNTCRILPSLTAVSRLSTRPSQVTTGFFFSGMLSDVSRSWTVAWAGNSTNTPRSES
jgi:drug/metabolite transporter (DMT)-like permease